MVGPDIRKKDYQVAINWFYKLQIYIYVKVNKMQLSF